MAEEQDVTQKPSGWLARVVLEIGFVPQVTRRRAWRRVFVSVVVWLLPWGYPMR